MIAGAPTTSRTTDMAAFRSRLRQLMLERSLREGKQLSQSEVARESRVPLPTIQRWYDPDYTFNRLDADNAKRLKEYFGCAIDDLVEIVGE
jgi:transcriptional regulator with XRE-family HTH domain